MTLHIHHLIYKKSKEIWDIESKYLVTLCNECHEYIHRTKSSIGAIIADIGVEYYASIHGLLIDVIMFDEDDYTKLYKLMKKNWPDKVF